MKISEVKPIHEAGDMIERKLPDSRGCIVTRDELKRIVELPCVPVALSLYDKNIRTREADANQNSIKNGYAEITIDINSLSEENKEILRKKYPKQYEKAMNNPNKEEVTFAFRVQINKNSTVEQVSEAFLKLTEDLESQDVLYGREKMGDVLEECIYREVVTLNENETKEDVIQTLFRDKQSIEVIQEYGLLNSMEYFDFESNEIWATKELYDKHKAYFLTLQKKKNVQITPTAISELGKKEMQKKTGRFSSLYHKVKSRLNGILNKDEKNRN